MPAATLLILQLASATPAPMPAQAAPLAAPTEAARTALLHPVPPSNCAARTEEIVVCGRNADAYRLPDGAARAEVTGPPKAEWKLFGDTRIGVGATQRSVGGYSAPAAMVTITVPF